MKIWGGKWIYLYIIYLSDMSIGHCVKSGNITSLAYRLFRSQRAADTSNLHAAVECCCHRLVLANHSRSTGGGGGTLMLKLANNNIRPLCQVARQIVKTGTNEIDGCGEHANQSKKVLKVSTFPKMAQFLVRLKRERQQKKKEKLSKTFHAEEGIHNTSELPIDVPSISEHRCN